MRRMRGQPSLLTLCRNYALQKSDFEKPLISRTLICIASVVGLLGLAYATLSTVNVARESTETVRNKFHYKRVVDSDGYQDNVLNRNSGKINEIGSGKRDRQSEGRRLFTEDLSRQNSVVDDQKALHRIRRDRYSEIEYYSDYRQHRSASQQNLKLPTITVVHNNRIEKEIEETPTEGERNTSERSPATKHGKGNLEKSQDSKQNLSEMDVIYSHTLDTCQRQLQSNQNQNQTNSSSHDNATAPHADAHGDNCDQEIASGLNALWVILYILIILFLFIGLAIICDDFFIDSLTAISERLDLSEDVAGATFMAAGSSAPELFISIAGAGAGSDVGVGTIVGSAVFNLLIIIALTASLAGQILSLDWRPFVRDSIFYSFSIVAFIAFSLDAEFRVWESLLLLVLYALYIVVMKFNPQLMDWMATWRSCSCYESRVAPEVQPSRPEPVEAIPNPVAPVRAPSPMTTISKTVTTTSPPQNINKTDHVATKLSPTSTAKSSAREEFTTSADRLAPKQFPRPKPSSSPSINGTKSKTELSSSAKNIGSESRGGACTCVSGCVATQPQACTCCVIHITSRPCVFCATCRGLPASRIRCSSCSSAREVPLVVAEKSQGEDNGASEKAAPREAGIVDGKGSRLPNIAGNGVRPEWNAAIVTHGSTGNAANESDPDRPRVSGDVNGDVAKLSETFAEKTSPGVGAPAPEQGENEDAEPEIVILPCLPSITNSRPDKPDSGSCISGVKYVAMYGIYLLSFPWICAFTWTVPKCNTPQKRKWYLISFVICILWIALVSWVMIELVEKIGCLLNIDTYTMGLIVVAVGTSVPDAISSVLVAKEGHGDMAVSNALGSNVFDINLGLGLPFFLGSIITGEPIRLMSPLQTCLYETLPLSFKLVPHVKFGLVLLAILLVAVGVFMLVKFRLNMKVTILFITMYVAFMIYALVQEKKCYSFFC